MTTLYRFQSVRTLWRQMMSKTIKDSGFKDWRPEQLPDLTGKTFVKIGRAHV